MSGVEKALVIQTRYGVYNRVKFRFFSKLLDVEEDFFFFFFLANYRMYVCNVNENVASSPSYYERSKNVEKKQTHTKTV